MSSNVPLVAKRRRGSRMLRASGVGVLFLGLATMFVPSAQATTSGETIAVSSSSCTGGNVSVAVSFSNVAIGKSHRLTSPQGTFYYEGTTTETQNIYADTGEITWQSAAPILTPAQITVTLERTSDSTVSNSVTFDNPCFVPDEPEPCTQIPSPGDGYTTPDDGCTWMPPIEPPCTPIEPLPAGQHYTSDDHCTTAPDEPEPCVTIPSPGDGYTTPDDGCTWVPPVVNPPVENPPVGNPPVVNPPVGNPPVENPPVVNPPASHTPVVASPVVPRGSGYPVGAGTSGQGTSLTDNTSFLASGVVLSVLGLLLLAAPQVRRAKAGK
ncbi:MAG: hypothetical protein JWM37_139 [Candidatus Saccharibacteria bacterium]|nr:hypothetical protein [Candidatus Saccharibacteria bacterium]